MVPHVEDVIVAYTFTFWCSQWLLKLLNSALGATPIQLQWLYRNNKVASYCMRSVIAESLSLVWYHNLYLKVTIFLADVNV